MRALLLMLTFVSAAGAHVWRSADGKQTVDAEFGGLKGGRVLLLSTGGKASVHELKTFCAEDQQFAQLAHQVQEQSGKLGPRTFQASLVLGRGAVCRMGSEMRAQKGKWLFTGETFFLQVDKEMLLRREQRWDACQLFPCGTRNYLLLDGTESSIPAYALTLESAAEWMLQQSQRAAATGSTDPERVVEPIIQLAQSYGLAVPVGKGLLLTDLALVKDAQSMNLHVQQKDLPLTVVKLDSKLGVALLSHPPLEEMEPARLASRKPAELGQPVYAVGMELNTSRKGFTTTPTLSKGIISKLGNTAGAGLRHDADVPGESLGGYLISEKGEVLGLYFQTYSRLEGKRGAAAELPASSDAGPVPTVSTEALPGLLEGVAGAARPRILSAGDLPQTVQALRAVSLLVIATREIRTEPATPVVGKAAPPGGLTYSLSKTGTRHNSGCKFFKPDAPCQATEGKPCKVCGG